MSPPIRESASGASEREVPAFSSLIDMEGDDYEEVPRVSHRKPSVSHKNAQPALKKERSPVKQPALRIQRRALEQVPPPVISPKNCIDRSSNRSRERVVLFDDATQSDSHKRKPLPKKAAKEAPASSKSKTDIVDYRDATIFPLRICVASWNMEYRVLTEDQVMPRRHIRSHSEKPTASDLAVKARRKSIHPFMTISELEYPHMYTNKRKLSTILPFTNRELPQEENNQFENKLKALLAACELEAMNEINRSNGREAETDGPDAESDDDNNTDVESKVADKFLSSSLSLAERSLRYTRKASRTAPRTKYTVAGINLVNLEPVTPAAQRRSAMKNTSRGAPVETIPLKDWLQPGYDIYVVALQEAVGDVIPKCATEYLSTVHAGRKFVLYSSQDMTLAGHGDGAYFRKKTTTVALILAQDLLWPAGPVRITGSAAASIDNIPGGGGSKGAVSVSIEVFGQKLCFIGSHLPAKSAESRLEARLQIRESLGRCYARQLQQSVREAGPKSPSSLTQNSISTHESRSRFSDARGKEDLDYLNDGPNSNGDSTVFGSENRSLNSANLSEPEKFDICNVFHHVIWTGDFNFRHKPTQDTISAAHHLALYDIDGLLASDELLSCPASAVDLYNSNYEEAPIRFLPTYKKKAGRPPVDIESVRQDALTKLSRMSLQWVSDEYILYYQKRWYKGRKVTGSVPSWSDRILKWSLPAIRSLLCFIPDTYTPAYPAKPSVLLISDHSPISCGFSLYAPDAEASGILRGVNRSMHKLPTRSSVSRSAPVNSAKLVHESGSQNRRSVVSVRMR